MKKTILCLANSKKYSGRCIAGIEITPKPGGGWQMMRQHGKPKWLRPVSMQEHGQVDEKEVQDIRLLDVVEFDMMEESPQGFQTENVRLVPKSLRKICEMPRDPALLDVLADAQTDLIFGKPGKRVPKEEIAGLDHSLLFAKVERVDIYYPVVYKTLNPRAYVRFGGNTYDLPVTDLQTILELQENPRLLEGFENLYCTFSLGVEFEGWYYKIAAGIVYA